MNDVMKSYNKGKSNKPISNISPEGNKMWVKFSYFGKYCNPDKDF
jgi:hypothetical protein